MKIITIFQHQKRTLFIAAGMKHTKQRWKKFQPLVCPGWRKRWQITIPFWTSTSLIGILLFLLKFSIIIELESCIIPSMCAARYSKRNSSFGDWTQIKWSLVVGPHIVYTEIHRLIKSKLNKSSGFRWRWRWRRTAGKWMVANQAIFLSEYSSNFR